MANSSNKNRLYIALFYHQSETISDIISSLEKTFQKSDFKSSEFLFATNQKYLEMPLQVPVYCTMFSFDKTIDHAKIESTSRKIKKVLGRYRSLNRNIWMIWGIISLLQVTSYHTIVSHFRVPVAEDTYGEVDYYQENMRLQPALACPPGFQNKTALTFFKDCRLLLQNG